MIPLLDSSLSSLCSLRLLLSEIPISAPELFSFLGCALFGVSVYALLLHIQVDRKKLAAGTPENIVKPSPLIVKEADEYVTAEACGSAMFILSRRVEVLERKFSEIRDEMKKDSNRLSIEGEQRSRRLHERIEAVSQSLGHDIKNLPAQLFEMMRNAKGTFGND